MEFIDFNKSNFCHPLDVSVVEEMISGLDGEDKLLFEAEKSERIFIKNLVIARKELGLTQSELAKKTGLTQQVISNIEKCGRKPTLTNLIRYLLGLGLDINSIFNL